MVKVIENCEIFPFPPDSFISVIPTPERIGAAMAYIEGEMKCGIQEPREARARNGR